jgi:RNA polymerase sigma-70 factor (ECF subfamily)
MEGLTRRRAGGRLSPVRQQLIPQAGQGPINVRQDGADMTPTRSPEPPLDQQYESNLELIRERIIKFATAKMKRGAEDVAHGCIVVLIEKYAHVRDLPSMMKIAIGIARNKMFEQFRQDKREIQFPENTGDHANTFEEAVPDPAAILPELERRQVVDLILGAMLRLGEKCRNVLRLKLIENKSSATIKEILGVNSINTVYTWERRCLQQLIDIAGGTLYVRTD